MKLTDQRLRDIESWAHKLTPLSAPILGDQIGSMARELLLLRAECRAARAYKVRHETLARKPLDGTVAANVLKHGVGGINVDATRIHPGDEVLERPPLSTNKAEGWKRPWNDDLEARSRAEETKRIAADKAQQLGRWPANLILDEEAAAMLDEQSGTLTSGSRAAGVRKGMGFHGADGDGGPAIIGNSGGASRFFYVAKASKSERGEGNAHPTVKPVKLMRYLCRLITPPRGLVLDPFMGSGSTGVAAKAEGFEFVGIEREKEYFEIAQARMSK